MTRSSKALQLELASGGGGVQMERVELCLRAVDTLLFPFLQATELHFLHPNRCLEVYLIVRANPEDL